LATFSSYPFTSSYSTVFVENVYSLTTYDVNSAKTRITLNGKGTVISTPNGISCGLKCVLSQTAGEPLTLTATAKIGFVFSGWRGDCQGFKRVITLNTLKGNHNCTAVFNSTAAIPQ
jgi:hypothetical protein